jgi:monoterpene epsilon-lactone hydrolase
MASLRSRFFRMMVEMSGKRLFDASVSVEQQRAMLEKSVSHSPLPRGISIEGITIGEMHAEWLRVLDSRPGYVLFFLHGGAYYLGSCHTTRPLAARVALAAKTDAFLIDYRLAPENPFPAALDDATAAYRWLLDQGIQPDYIVIGGESAGGGLALATLLALRDAGDPLPAAAVCLSPWTDLANTGESYQTRAKGDPLRNLDTGRSAAMYVGDDDPKNPLISPLYGDLRGLPPLLIHVGDHEMLLSDSTCLADHAREAGVPVTLKVWDGMWHVFQSMGNLMPESRRAIQEIGDFVRGQLKI